MEQPITQRSWLFRPNLIVFVSNFCIMTLELVAGRIIAPYVGVSLYTWTTIIGIVLAGISLGNYLGGLLADRAASLRVLGLIFIFGGTTALGVLAVDVAGTALPSSWNIITQIVVITTALFFIPATILGMTSPVVAKLAVTDLAKTGQTVGKIYAAGTVGSIAGTFATGFYLIAAFGTHTIVWAVGAIIISMGILFYMGGRTKALAPIGLLLIGGSLGVSQLGLLDSICAVETNYFCIRVKEEELPEGKVRKLILDRLVHSFNSLEDPLQLTYGYEHMYAELTEVVAQRNPQLRALFIGGGGYTFPRYMETLYPESGLDVIEIDPGVTEVAYQALGISRDTKARTFNEDARGYLMREPDNRYDIIFGDAFNDFSVPYHLTTNEFNKLIDNWLTDDGVYIVNMIDGGHADFLRAYAHTLEQTFDYVYVSPTISTWRLSPHSTFVLLASNEPLDVSQLLTVKTPGDTRIFGTNLLTDSQYNTLMSESTPVLLTDRYAPVEQMLAPAFRDETLE